MQGVFQSRFFKAMVLFALINLSVGVCGLAVRKPDDFPFLSWTGWTIKAFLGMQQPANIVFLGSSLMLVPLDGVDADFLNERVDGSQHHHSAFFESTFQKLTGLSTRSFTFALPGEMPSDAYLIVNNLLHGNRRPDILVYGVGPRDFLDNLLPSPASTDPFRYLSRFGDITPIADRVLTDWQERFSYELGRLYCLYGDRETIATNAGRAITPIVDRMLPKPAGTPEITFDDKHVLFPEYRPCQISQGQAIFRPIPIGQAQPFLDNVAEYKKRYAKLNWDTYLTQMGFLADALQVARDQGVKCVVVAMPLTEVNRSLLSKQSWSAYINGVASTAKAKGATFIDFSAHPDFVQSDFGDTVHLHSGGGRKFLEKLAQQMSKDTSVVAALERSKTRIAGKGGQL